jgi:uncharacterized RDD family membrane protein YckC
MIDEKYQTFWPRLGAIFADATILLPISLTSNWVWRHPDKFSLPFIALSFLVTQCFWQFYEIWMLGKYGQTIGRMLLKIEVVDLTETTHINYWQAVKRNIVPLCATAVAIPYDVYLILTGKLLYRLHPNANHNAYLMTSACVLTCWAVLEFVTMLFSRKRRAIHDFIAGTVVIKCSNTPLEPIR